MQPNDPTILITAGVDQSLLSEITAKGFVADVIPFIKTESIRSEKVRQTIKSISKLNATIVFTSSNAVEAVHHFVQSNKVNWKIYCVGNSTKSLIENLFDSTVIAVADNATKLAQEIIADKENISELYFFCGDKRRNELPLLLTQSNIVVNEIEVYTTTIVQHRLSKDYDGILFFSPSAVDGFFKSNSLNDKTVLFAIGDTTANEIKKYCENKIIIADKPGRKEVVEKMVEYLSAFNS
jgi:uroporphyrinogen-III synthase